MSLKQGRLILIILCGSIALFGFLFMICKSEREYEDLFEEYPLVSIDYSLSNKIINKRMESYAHLRNSPSIINVKLDINKKISIWAHYYQDTKIEIDNMVFSGDSLVKHAGSDTVYVYKQNSKSESFDYFLIIHTEN